MDYKREQESSKRDEILKIFDYFDKCEKFILSGGEPTTTDFFFDVLKAAKKKTNNLALQTNGSLLYDKKLCKKLVDMGINDVTLSFHSHDRKKFDYLTQTKGQYDHVLKALKNFLDLGIVVKTSTVISRYNKDDILETVRFLQKFDKLNKIKLVYASFNKHSDKDAYISLSECGKVLQEIDKLNVKNLSIENVPLCIFDSRKYHANNLNVFKVVLLTEKGIVDPHSRIFIDKCKTCKVKSECQGIYKNYSFLFNPEQELKPFN